ncbi:MAG: NAD(P)/FAD-dependent oxidoreductase [Elusimicrobia bacterium]|nr:NAD(P)/FAD-dependent oxidoreductase [Elusimicrobiota bacterium]
MDGNTYHKKAVIIGAGPAGLSAAYELLNKTDIIPLIYEQQNEVGGIARTVEYKGNRMDIGGHRFFSKCDKVIRWWLDIMPLEAGYSYRDHVFLKNPSVPMVSLKTDNRKVMLIRNRISRIYFLEKFFDYPISLASDTFRKLGISRTVKILRSYFITRINPLKKNNNLEDFFIARFGKELYNLFFKDYTQKVWGVSCSEIGSEWGEERIKRLSLVRSVIDSLSYKIFRKTVMNPETSLIRQFMYPKLGCGQFWEELAGIVKEKKCQIYLDSQVVGLKSKDKNITHVIVKNRKTDEISTVEGDYFISSMPIVELINGLEDVPLEVKKVAEKLRYRDIIIVGLLVSSLKIKNDTGIRTVNNIVPDCWIYIQEKRLKLSRIQIYNNWSPYMINKADTVWLGLEYLCNKEDALWQMKDDDVAKTAINELEQIGFIERNEVSDSTVVRMQKAYPAYFGSYDRIEIIKNFTDQFENLFLIGRNGMHKYNNQDHAIMTAMAAVENIARGIKDKKNIWSVNPEREYREAG